MGSFNLRLYSMGGKLQGDAVQVDPMKFNLKPPGIVRLKLICDDPHQIMVSNSTCAATARGNTLDTTLRRRGLHSFRIQLNLSSSIHRNTKLSHECVLELLELSCNVNESKPLHVGGGGTGV